MKAEVGEESEEMVLDSDQDAGAVTAYPPALALPLALDLDALLAAGANAAAAVGLALVLVLKPQTLRLPPWELMLPSDAPCLLDSHCSDTQLPSDNPDCP